MLDDDHGGEGEPIPDDGPEWDSVEAERDYWKGLARSYGAKLRALEHVMGATWTIKNLSDGAYVVREDGLPGDGRTVEPVIPLPSLEDLAKHLRE